MGWSVSRHSEPSRKLALFAGRLRTLRGLVKRDASSDHIAMAAEKLRLSALGVIKAKRALNQEYPHRDPDGRQSHKFDEEEQRWRALSPQAIAEAIARDMPDPEIQCFLAAWYKKSTLVDRGPMNRVVRPTFLRGTGDHHARPQV